MPSLGACHRWSSLGLAALLLAGGAGIVTLAACHRNDFADVVLPPFPSATAEDAEPPPGVLWREEVDRVVADGLGYFLQRVTVEPRLDQGAFVGWEIQDLRPPEAWQSVDLCPSDVVTSINGLPIERDQEAFAAFEGLKKAKELRVTYLRDGETRELVFRILPRGRVGTTAIPAAPSASAGSSPRPASSAATTAPAVASAR
ncbi:MAG: hypothetical protein JW751_06740 [Polyangiaceae bacterium]|nr:hypothetical protein [Polyangiaceae bacterium]